MADLFTAGEKAAFSSHIDDIHSTFSRPIQVAAEPTRTVISTSQNPLYSYPRSPEDVILTPNVRTINARILYGKPQNEGFADGTKYNDITVDIPAGWVRIKIAAADYEVLSSAKRITMDGLDFYIDSHSRGHGLFDINYYTFYLKPMNSD